MKKLILTFLLLAFAASTAAMAEDDLVMKAMKDELARSMQQLHLPDVEKPYFIAYRVDDSEMTYVTASLGALTTSNSDKSRSLRVEVRVGDYNVDNTNFMSRGRIGGGSRYRSLPLDDDYDEIRRLIWLTTDSEYKSATETLSSKRSALKSRTGGTSLPDFTSQAAFTHFEPASPVKADLPAMEKLARQVSEAFSHSPEIFTSGVNIMIRNLYTRYVDSEGSTFTKSSPMVTINLRASTRAADGMPLSESADIVLRSPADYDPAQLIERANKLASRLKALRNAATVERYNGPVLFEKEAAAQAFAQIFAPQLVTARFPLSDEPQFESGFMQFMNQANGPPLSDKLGGRVMPEVYDVVDKPQVKSFDGKSLVGTSAVDDEAVATHELTLVQNGILKGLLGTRTPTKEVKTTTGSRHGFGASPTNLFLTTQKGISEEELRAKFMAMVKERGLEYGIVVRDVGAVGLSWLGRMGSAMASRSLGDTGEVEAYKVFPDGHEEPIRNIEFAPMMANAFRDIVAASNKPTAYSGPFLPTTSLILAGMSGADFGGDPFTLVSYVVPSLLFDDVGLKKTEGPSPNPPIVPSPMQAEGK